jgi:alcohol dehydrogenase (cytochrome c)
MLGILLSACGVTAATSGVSWRFRVVEMKLRGEMPSLGWGEMLLDLRPGSPVYLGELPMVPNLDLAISNPYTTPKDSAQGAQSFRRGCASCHGIDARSGTVGPNLVSVSAERRLSDWALYRSISHGIPGTAMRAHDLSPRTIWQLVAYIQSLRSADSTPARGQAVSVPFSKLLKAGADSTSWLTYSGDYQSHRYSALKSINARTVRRLRVAWQYQSAANETRFETSPLAVGGALYFTEPPGNVVAVDASDGSVRWRYVRPVPDGVSLCCGAVNRGLAVIDSLLYLGTLDAHLIALDARNGVVAWDRVVADWHDGYSITGAPLAVRNKIITGIAGGEFGVRGFLAAFDAATGKPAWRFSTVPLPGERGSETWSGSAWKRGGAPTWLTGSYDPQLNLIYWGVGNPSPDFHGEDRPGDNLYSNSVIALDADSGSLRWHFQFTPHDEHDWDAVQIPVLIDTLYKGVSRPLMAWANRNAFYYLLDRRTGEFLLAQPFARQSWAESIDSLGRPHVISSSRPSRTGALVYPSVGGATNWWSPSFSPRTGLFYVPVVEGSSIVFDEKPKFQSGELFLGSVSQQPTENIAMVRALDPLSGKMKWEHRFETDRSSRHSSIAGVLSVGGDLLFVGSEQTFYALDARTGAELWRFNAGGRIAAAPVSYFANGKQYVVIAAGRSLIAFALESDHPN